MDDDVEGKFTRIGDPEGYGPGKVELFYGLWSDVDSCPKSGCRRSHTPPKPADASQKQRRVRWGYQPGRIAVQIFRKGAGTRGAELEDASEELWGNPGDGGILSRHLGFVIISRCQN